jgi:hypothetical protein
MTANHHHPATRLERGARAATGAVCGVGIERRADHQGARECSAVTLDCRKWKGPVGAARAIDRLVDAMPSPPDLREPGFVLWRYLVPVAALPVAPGAEAEAPRPGLVMMGVIAGMKKAPCRAHLFGAAFSAHSLGRLLDRTGFQSDPVKAMHAAHDALLALPAEEGNRLFDLPGFPLPAGPGAFLTTLRRVGADRSPLAVASTWISTDQTYDDQVSDLAAWQRLLNQFAASASG